MSALGVIQPLWTRSDCPLTSVARDDAEMGRGPNAGPPPRDIAGSPGHSEAVVCWEWYTNARDQVRPADETGKTGRSPHRHSGCRAGLTRRLSRTCRNTHRGRYAADHETRTVNPAPPPRITAPRRARRGDQARRRKQHQARDVQADPLRIGSMPGR